MTLFQTELGLRHISYHVPENIRGNAELIEKNGFDESFLKDKIGIRERRISSPDEATSDLAVAACEKLFADSGLKPEEVECLIVVTQTPDYTLPHTAAIVQDRIGVPKSAASFDVSLGCSGYVYGLSVILSFMQMNGMKNGVLVTAEEYSKLMSDDDRATTPLFGDGAAATWISAEPKYKLGQTLFGSDGSGGKELIARGTGTRLEDREPLYMNGRAIYNFMMTVVPKNIEACLETNGLTKDDVDCWVFHQASKFMLQSLAKKLAIDTSKMVIEVNDIGNTTSSTIPIALARTMSAGNFEAKNILISGFGVGLSWASSMLIANGDGK